MTKSELIELITAKQKHLPAKDVELALKQMLEIMSDALAAGERIEIRGFGSFSLHFRPPRQGRNPKTGEAVALSGKYVPHFKPGKDLRERVNDGIAQPIRFPLSITPADDGSLEVKGEFSIDRLAYGIGAGSDPTSEWVGRNIGVQLDLTAR